MRAPLAPRKACGLTALRKAGMLAFFVFVSTSAVLTAGDNAAQVQRPNFVMLFVDDLGYGDLGFTGHPSTLTPTLDRLASQGKRLTSWYSGYSVCSASRAALLTGRQPPRIGMPGVINSLSAAGLPLNETTIADHLRAGGYRTLAIGKWHQGQQPQYLPRERGFDRFSGLPFSVDDGEGYASNCTNKTVAVDADNLFIGSTGAEKSATSFMEPPHTVAWEQQDPARRPPDAQALRLGPSLPLPSIRQTNNSSVIVQQPVDLVPLTAIWWNETRQFLQDYVGGVAPFFAYIAFGHVHTATPNVYPQMGLRQYAGCAFQGLTGRGPFGDALAEVDWFVGQLVAELDALGVSNDTLILFASDNGPSLRWGIGAGSAGLFSGAAATFANGTSYTNTGKGSTWEGGIRMPAFAYWPGTVPPHSRSSEVISTMDVLPSLLRLAGLPVPGQTIEGEIESEEQRKFDTKRTKSDGVVLDGKDSLADIILGTGGSKHSFLPFYNGYFGNASTEIFAARAGRYKAHWVTAPGLGGGRWPTDAHAAPEKWYHDPPLVFDVEADPSETFPLQQAQLPKNLLADLSAAKQSYEEHLSPRSIDMRFGFEWALCCGVGCVEPCNCTCDNVALPLP